MKGNNIGPCLLESLAYASPGVVLRGGSTRIAGFGGTSLSTLSGGPVGDLRLGFWNPEFRCFFCLSGYLAAIYRDNGICFSKKNKHKLIEYILCSSKENSLSLASQLPSEPLAVLTNQPGLGADPQEDFSVLQVVFRPLCFLCFFSPLFVFVGVSANRLTGGAMQLTFRKMAFDYYPFHWAGRRMLNACSFSVAEVLKTDA